jgi:hypothetical protein
VLLSIIEFGSFKLFIAHGLTFISPNLRGWEAFSTPRALTHTRMTWTFSPMAPQVVGVTIWSPPCINDVLGTPYEEVHDRGWEDARSRKREMMDMVFSSIMELHTIM